MAKKPNRFEACVTFKEGKTLYRAELLRLHPDQGGEAQELIQCKKEFDNWVSRKAWEAHHQPDDGDTFSGPYRRHTGHTPGDVEDYLSDRTKQFLREVIESGINCDVEVVGSFIWLDNVAPGDFMTLIWWDFTRSKKYDGRWFWADWDHLKATGNLPRGQFNGNFDDMKKIHQSKVKQQKLYIGQTNDQQAEEFFK